MMSPELNEALLELTKQTSRLQDWQERRADHHDEQAKEAEALQQERWNEQLAAWRADIEIKRETLKLHLAIFKMVRLVFFGLLIAAVVLIMAGGVHV